MKKLVILMVVLLLVTACAEGMPPQMFLGSRGLMVLDGNQLASMGGSAPDASEFGGMNIAGFSAGDGDKSAPSIFLVYNDVIYAALDMTAMFGQPTLDAKGMSQVFIDLCEAYDFDVLTYNGEDNASKYSYGDIDAFMQLAAESDEVTDGAENPYDNFSTLEEFVAAVRADVEG